MCSRPFQVRIASIIPTIYNAVADGKPDGAPPRHLQGQDAFKKAVDDIMTLVAKQWADVSHSTIRIVPQSKLVNTEVKRLTTKGQIKEPGIDVFTGEACIRDAMVYYVWVVYPPDRQKLPAPHYDSRGRVWVPCRETDVIDAVAALLSGKKRERTKNVVKRVRHEFKHWLVHAVRRMMDKELDKKDGHKRGLSKEEIFKRFDPHIIRALSEYHDYKQEWDSLFSGSV